MVTSLIRLVATADFLGAFAPARTTYGSLPGGVGLRRHIDRHRNSIPTLWVDTGDFSAGPLTRLNGSPPVGDLAELGIDVAALGNHEFDDGGLHIARYRETFGTVLGPPGIGGTEHSAIVDVDGVMVGFIYIPSTAVLEAAGMRTVRAGAFDFGFDAAASLRRDGAHAVVAIVHDGIRCTLDARARSSVFADAEVAAPPWPKWDGVDVIIGGHTLGWGRATVAGRPFIQPAPFGASVAVIDISTDHADVVASTRIEHVTDVDLWDGPSAPVIDTTAEHYVGEIDQSWVSAVGADRYLPDFVADAVRAANDCDAAIVPAAQLFTQPAFDGAVAALPRTVELFDVVRLHPFAIDEVVVVDVTRTQYDAVVASLTPKLDQQRGWDWCGLQPGLSGDLGANGGTVAFSSWWVHELSSVLHGGNDAKTAHFGIVDSVLERAGSRRVH